MGIVEVLYSLLDFALISAVLGGIAAAGYCITRPMAVRASTHDAPGVGDVFLLWMHSDLRGDDSDGNSETSDTGDAGGD